MYCVSNSLCRCGREAFVWSDCRLAGQEQICSVGQDPPGPQQLYIQHTLTSIFIIRTVLPHSMEYNIILQYTTVWIVCVQMNYLTLHNFVITHFRHSIIFLWNVIFCGAVDNQESEQRGDQEGPVSTLWEHLLRRDRPPAPQGSWQCQTLWCPAKEVRTTCSARQKASSHYCTVVRSYRSKIYTVILRRSYIHCSLDTDTTGVDILCRSRV